VEMLLEKEKDIKNAGRKEEEKNPVNKYQRWEPIHQKYKANENTSRHNPKFLIFLLCP
jgi:hypothetical protein